METLPVLAEGLRKRYGKASALDGFDLAVPEGSVCGLLGPNGAGKTTAVRILTTLLRPDGGQARVAGFDVVRQAAQLRERLGLGDTGTKPVKQSSGGMRRRLDRAASLILAPPVLFLDEPTTGLDPRGRNEVWAAVRALVANGTTVLLTTQYLDEADQLADQVSVIDQGRVIADGSPDQLKSKLGGDRIDVVAARADELAATAAIVARVSGDEPEVDPDTRRVSAPVRDRVAALTAAARELDAAAVAVEDVALRRPTLDEVFLHLTGHDTEAAEERPQEVTA